MSDNNFQNDRRRLLRGALMGVAAAPLVYAGVRGSQASAQDMPKLAEDDPTAVALNYVHNAADKNDMRSEGANCANCALYQSNDSEWGACSVFPGKLVNANGWCSAWVG